MPTTTQRLKDLGLYQIWPKEIFPVFSFSFKIHNLHVIKTHRQSRYVECIQQPLYQILMIIFTSINLAQGLEHNQHETPLQPTVLADSQHKDGDTECSANTQNSGTGKDPFLAPHKEQNLQPFQHVSFPKMSLFGLGGCIMKTLTCSSLHPCSCHRSCPWSHDCHRNNCCFGYLIGEKSTQRERYVKAAHNIAG